jgi:hypothetical protein
VLGSLVGEPTRAHEGASLRVTDERADAFRRLVDRSLDASYGLAAVILNDRIEAEDAVHDAAISAWRSFDSLREPDRFEAWFRRILVLRAGLDGAAGHRAPGRAQGALRRERYRRVPQRDGVAQPWPVISRSYSGK